MSQRYREYFIGGPWHGQDRLDMAYVQPQYTGIILYRDQPEPIIGESLLDEPSSQGMYHLRRFHMFGETLVAWMDYKETDESATKKLAELILAPHKRTDES